MTKQIFPIAICLTILCLMFGSFFFFYNKKHKEDLVEIQKLALDLEIKKRATNLLENIIFIYNTGNLGSIIYHKKNFVPAIYLPFLVGLEKREQNKIKKLVSDLKSLYVPIFVYGNWTSKTHKLANGLISENNSDVRNSDIAYVFNLVGDNWVGTISAEKTRPKSEEKMRELVLFVAKELKKDIEEDILKKPL